MEWSFLRPLRADSGVSRSVRAFVGFAAILAAVAGCSSNQHAPRVAEARAAQQNSFAAALGPGKYLIPLPGDDQSLLGRIVVAEPPQGGDIEAYTRPNPCAQFLTEPQETRLESQFVDAMSDLTSADGSILASFGFGASLGYATHLTYSVKTTRQVVVSDTLEYEACCAERGCGYGFVRSMVYGEGEYASAKKAEGSVGATQGVVQVGTEGEFELLQRRLVRGWLAASVGLTRQPLGGAPVAGVGVNERPEAPALARAAEPPLEPPPATSVPRLRSGEATSVGAEVPTKQVPIPAGARPDEKAGPGAMPPKEASSPAPAVSPPVQAPTPAPGAPPRVSAAPVMLPRLNSPDLTANGGGAHASGALSAAQLKSFENGKLLVLGDGADFRFVDASGKEITENEFVNRYEKLTGSEELDQYWKHRELGKAVAIGLPLTVVGGGMIIAAAAINPSDEKNALAVKFPLYFFGGALALSGVAVTITFLAMPNGTPKDHTMTEYEAHEYVTRYNQQLLERVKQRESSNSVAHAFPWQSLLPGIRGTF